jgi:hypothetical protein
MTGYAEMRAAVLAYAEQHPDMDPLDIHWVIPLKLRRDVPEVHDMPGSESDVLVMVRGILCGWYLRGPGEGRLPPAPPIARDPRDPRRRPASAR